MKQFLLIIILSLLFATLSRPAVVHAEPEAGAAAKLISHVPQADTRVDQLRGFLASHNSPMTLEAQHFVKEADRLGLDWKLVAAIAGVESTFGKQVPAYSNNGWGWGVFTGTNDGVHFKDWKDGITQVSEGLRYNYVDKGAKTIESMGRIYAASPRWAGSVRFFMNKIDTFIPNQPELLAVTI